MLAGVKRSLLSRNQDSPIELIRIFLASYLIRIFSEFLSLKGGCTASSDSTLVKMPRCWKSHVVAQNLLLLVLFVRVLDHTMQIFAYGSRIGNKKGNLLSKRA